MWTSAAIKAVVDIRARENWSREQILSHQEKSFRQLVSWAWNHSPFYHDYYQDHGIREAQLVDLTPRDVPMVSKELLMEHFDRISRDPLLSREKLERWIHSDAPMGRYANKYIVVHTSGTGGTMGIFVHDRIGWSRFRGTTAVRGRMNIRYNPFRPNRFAFYGATHGRFAGVTSLQTSPRLIVKKLTCSILDPIDKVVTQLNAFQPEYLTAYPSALRELALKALDGVLSITPHYLLTAGEVLIPPTAEIINRAFGKSPVNTYAASESMCIALQRPDGPGLSLMEDENVVEILDDHDQPVAPGEKGRVVLTNLGNRAMPIIRYEMRDIVTRGHRRQDEPFDQILAVDGRTNDALPIRSRSGNVDSIHPGVLAEFFVPGIVKCQFEGVSPDEITLRYLAPMSLDQEIEREFQKILSLKEANPNVQVNITRVTNLSADEKTGKFRLVILRQPGSSRCFT